MENDRTHAEIWTKVGELEREFAVVAERLEGTSNLVAQNQEEFRGKIQTLERTTHDTAVAIQSHRAEFKAGTGLLAFLIVTGIGALGLFLNV